MTVKELRSLLSVFTQRSWLFTDVSGQSIGPVFEGQAVQVLDCSTLEASADVVPKCQLTITNQRCVTPQKSKDINYNAAVA